MPLRPRVKPTGDDSGARSPEAFLNTVDRVLGTANGLVSGTAQAEMHSNRVATFPVAADMAADEVRAREAAAEVIDVTGDGVTVICADSPLGVTSRIAIPNPARPAPLGTIAPGGDPTSVVVIGDTVITGVSISDSHTAPSGNVISMTVAGGSGITEWGMGRAGRGKNRDGAGWTGLSEIVAHGDRVCFVERNNPLGETAFIKPIPFVPAPQMAAAPRCGALSVVSREVVRDLLPDRSAPDSIALDKVKGVVFAVDDSAWVSTDTDGVDDYPGETVFFAVGTLEGSVSRSGDHCSAPGTVRQRLQRTTRSRRPAKAIARNRLAVRAFGACAGRAAPLPALISRIAFDRFFFDPGRDTT